MIREKRLLSFTVAVHRWTPSSGSRSPATRTFALLLEAQAPLASPALLHARPPDAEWRARPCPGADPGGARYSRARARDVGGDARRRPSAEVDVVLLRQDPPFDLAYVTTTHLLERIHPAHACGQRPARSVRDAPEKLFVMDFPETDAGHRRSRAVAPRSRLSAANTLANSS